MNAAPESPPPAASSVNIDAPPAATSDINVKKKIWKSTSDDKMMTTYEKRRLAPLHEILQEYNERFSGKLTVEAAQQLLKDLCPHAITSSSGDFLHLIHSAGFADAAPLLADAQEITPEYASSLLSLQKDNVARLEKALSEADPTAVMKLLEDIEGQFIPIPEVLKQSAYPGDEVKESLFGLAHIIRFGWTTQSVKDVPLEVPLHLSHKRAAEAYEKGDLVPVAPFTTINEFYVEQVMKWDGAKTFLSSSKLDHCIDVLTNGFKISLPPLLDDALTPPKLYHNNVTEAASMEIENMRRRGIVSVVEREDCLCIAPLKFVEKDDHSIRVCLNSAALNDVLDNEDVYLDDPFDALLWSKTYFTKLDFKSCFYQILIHPESRKYLCFTYGGKFYQYNRLVMGLRPSPGLCSQIFTLLIEWLKDMFPGLAIGHFIDDVLLAMNDAAALRDITQKVVTILHSFGVALSLEKCQLEPVKSIEWLGLLLNRDSLRLPKDKIQKYLETWEEYKVTRSFNTFRRLCGMLQYASVPDPVLRTMLPELEHAMPNSWRSLPAWKAEEMEKKVHLSTAQNAHALKVLKRLKENVEFVPHTYTCRHNRARPTFTIFTDASLEFYGFAQEGSGGSIIFKRMRIETQYLGNPIIHHELRAILRAIQAAHKCINIIIFSDSQPAIAAVHKARSSFPEIDLLIAEIYLAAQKRCIKFVLQWIPTEKNIADLPTRNLTWRSVKLKGVKSSSWNDFYKYHIRNSDTLTRGMYVATVRCPLPFQIQPQSDHQRIINHLNSAEAPVWIFKPENIEMVLSSSFSRDEASLRTLRLVLVACSEKFYDKDKALLPLWDLVHAGPQVTTLYSGAERTDLQAPVFEGCCTADEIFNSSTANTFGSAVTVPYNHKLKVKASKAKYPAEYFGKIQADTLARLSPAFNLLTATPEFDDLVLTAKPAPAQVTTQKVAKPNKSEAFLRMLNNPELFDGPVEEDLDTLADINAAAMLQRGVPKKNERGRQDKPPPRDDPPPVAPSRPPQPQPPPDNSDDEDDSSSSSYGNSLAEDPASSSSSSSSSSEGRRRKPLSGYHRHPQNTALTKKQKEPKPPPAPPQQPPPANDNLDRASQVSAGHGSIIFQGNVRIGSNAAIGTSPIRSRRFERSPSVSRPSRNFSESSPEIVRKHKKKKYKRSTSEKPRSRRLQPDEVSFAAQPYQPPMREILDTLSQMFKELHVSNENSRRAQYDQDSQARSEYFDHLRDAQAQSDRRFHKLNQAHLDLHRQNAEAVAQQQQAQLEAMGNLSSEIASALGNQQPLQNLHHEVAQLSKNLGVSNEGRQANQDLMQSRLDQFQANQDQRLQDISMQTAEVSQSVKHTDSILRSQAQQLEHLNNRVQNQVEETKRSYSNYVARNENLLARFDTSCAENAQRITDATDLFYKTTKASEDRLATRINDKSTAFLDEFKNEMESRFASPSLMNDLNFSRIIPAPPQEHGPENQGSNGPPQNAAQVDASYSGFGTSSEPQIAAPENQAQNYQQNLLKQPERNQIFQQGIETSGNFQSQFPPIKSQHVSYGSEIDQFQQPEIAHVQPQNDSTCDQSQVAQDLTTHPDVSQNGQPPYAAPMMTTASASGPSISYTNCNAYQPTAPPTSQQRNDWSFFTVTAGFLDATREALHSHIVLANSLTDGFQPHLGARILKEVDHQQQFSWTLTYAILGAPSAPTASACAAYDITTGQLDFHASITLSREMDQEFFYRCWINNTVWSCCIQNTSEEQMHGFPYMKYATYH